jgi:hypothetical protein
MHGVIPGRKATMPVLNTILQILNNKSKGDDGVVIIKPHQMTYIGNDEADDFENGDGMIAEVIKAEGDSEMDLVAQTVDEMDADDESKFDNIREYDDN